MKKTLLILTLLFGIGTSHGQSTIWSEDFESYVNETGVKGSGITNSGDYPLSSGKWSLDVSNANFTNQYDYFMTLDLDNDGDHQLVVQDSDGYPASGGIIYWISESIDISSYIQVSIDIDVSEDAGDNLENTDFYRLEYRIDGGSWTTFATNGYRENDFTAVTGTQTGLSGSTLEIRIKTRTTAGGEHIYFDNIIVTGNDKTTEVYDTGSQPAATTISSLNDTDNEAVEVFQMEIQDQGSGDGLPTKVTNIRLKPHTTNTADWTDNIQGFVIYDSNLNQYIPTTLSITDTAIDFTFNSTDLNISDNGVIDLSFYIFLNTSNIQDGKILSFMVDADNHGFTADSSGSDFASDFLMGDFNSNDFTIDVEATALQFLQQPTDVDVFDTMTPAVKVIYVDENSNIDIDYDSLGATATLSASGATLDASTTTDGTPVQGIMTFNDIKFISTGTGVTLRIDDNAGIANPTVNSNAFNVTGEQEILIKGNDTEIINGDNTPSQIDETDFRQVKVNGSTVYRTYTIYNTGKLDLNLTGTPMVSISGVNASDFTITGQPATPIVGGGSTTFTVSFDPSDYGIRTATVSIDNNDNDENPYTFDIQGTGADYTNCTGIDYIQDFEATPAQPELSYTNTSQVLNSSDISASLYPLGDSYYVSGSNAKYLNNYNAGGTIWFNTVDTRNYTDVEFSIRVASFSGTSGNGADLVDHVEILVSTDDGVTWSEELEVTGADSPYNAKWSFDSGTGIAEVAYDGDNNKTTFTPASGGYRTTDGYSTMRITNLPSVEKLKIKIWVKNNSADEYWILDDAKLIGRKATIWNGGAWTNGAPDEATKMIIEDNYDTANGNIHACECEIKSGKTITVSDGSNLEVEKNIINNGTIIVNNEGSLVQYKSDAVLSGYGMYQLNKTSKPLNNASDYVYWSSPLNSSTFSLGDIINNAWGYYKFDPNEANNGTNYPGWVALSATDIPVPGYGYAISAPLGTNAGTILTPQFIKDSDPFNNGNIIVNIYKKGGPNNIGDFNLLGNPYPSAIDFNALVNDPDNVSVNGSYYLWTNCAGLNGNHHQVGGYTVYATSGTNIAACDSNGGTAQAGQYIATAQGFFIEANTDNSTLTFKNAHRVTGNNDNFLNRPTQNHHVVWLNMTDDTGNFNQIAVGFYPDATVGFDRLFDAHSMSEGTGYALYAKYGDHKLVIDALPDTDIDNTIVPLVVEISAISNLTFSLDHQFGLDNFDILLYDHDSQNYTNLKNTDYMVNINDGIHEGRFELVFLSTLSVENESLTNVIVLSQNKGVFKLQSEVEGVLIKDVKVYNINAGILFEKNNVNTQNTVVDLSNLSNGSIILFKIITSDNKTLVKKAIKLK